MPAAELAGLDEKEPALPVPISNFRNLSLSFDLCPRSWSSDVHRMSRTVLIAVVAAFGNLLQGWDNAAIAGKYSYLKWSGF